MIQVPLDEAYLQWLYSQVGPVKTRRSSDTYWNILRIMFQKEFIWFVPNDDNRLEDGRELRHEFIEELGLTQVDKLWMDLGCSFLELLIGLSRRLAFEAGGEPRDWFWHLMNNLELDIYADNILIPEKRVDDILDKVIWRTYRKDGGGGLFPLRHPREDQTQVELWYQLSAYLQENEY